MDTSDERPQVCPVVPKDHVVALPWHRESAEASSSTFLEALHRASNFYGLRLPPDWTIEGATFDPRILFESVYQKGGFDAVTRDNLWDDVAKDVHSSSVQLQTAPLNWIVRALVKKNYHTWLHGFETIMDYQLGKKLDSSAKSSGKLDATLGESTTRTQNGTNMSAHHDDSTASITRPTSPPSNSLDQHVNRQMNSHSKLSTKATPSMSDDEHFTPGVSRVPLGRPTKKRLEKLTTSPSVLMELFSTRPEHGRPLIWRHKLDSTSSTALVQDYTKTPIPRVSSRLMGRQRETLLLRRVERALRDDTADSASERSAALNALITRTWNKGFFLALYPTLVDPLLKLAQQLLSSIGPHMFSSHNSALNTPVGERDSPLSQLLRISLIFRNMAQLQQNVSLMASHQGIFSLLTQFVTFPGATDSTQPHSTLSISQLSDLADKLESEFDSTSQTHSSNSSAPLDPIAIIQSLTSTSSRSQLKEIQLNGLEVLSKAISLVKLGAERKEPVSFARAAQAGDMEISTLGLELKNVLPTLVELATTELGKSSVQFLSVETLARLAMNPNSRPLWQALPLACRTQFVERMIHYGTRDDELADWALFAAFHFALNALDLAVAQEITTDGRIVEALMTMAAAYNLVGALPSAELTQAVAYRRHSFALRSVVILHRLVEFVSIKPYLLPYEDVIATIYLEAPAQISDAMHAVFLDMQS